MSFLAENEYRNKLQSRLAAIDRWIPPPCKEYRLPVIPKNPAAVTQYTSGLPTALAQLLDKRAQMLSLNFSLLNGVLVKVSVNCSYQFQCTIFRNQNIYYPLKILLYLFKILLSVDLIFYVLFVKSNDQKTFIFLLLGLISESKSTNVDEECKL